jgi:hypothetical protein
MCVGCCTTNENAQSKYGPVEESVLNVKHCLDGAYHGSIPDTLSLDGLMSVLTANKFINERNVLQDYALEFHPICGQYLLLVYDGPLLVVFDYGETPEVDGAPYRHRTKYFLEHLPKKL